jgi:hypothetical protein
MAHACAADFARENPTHQNHRNEENPMKNRFRHTAALLLFLALALILSACATKEPTATPLPPTNTPVPPTSTPVPPTDTPTPVPPTDTPTPVPPTDTPTPPPESAESPALSGQFTDEASGISLDLPEGWSSTSLFGITVISESQEAMDAIMNGETPNVAVILFAGSFEEMDVDPKEFDDLAELFEAQGMSPFGDEEALGEGWEMSPVTEIEIDGYPAAATEFASDLGTEDEVRGYAVIVILEDMERMAVYVGGVVPERWEELAPTIKAMAQSMTFSEPQAADLPTADVPLSDETFVNQAKGYSLVPPEGWLDMDLGEMVIFIPNLAAMEADVPTAIVVMADTVEQFLEGALQEISKDQLETVLTMAASFLDESMDLGEVENLTVNDLSAVGAELSVTADDGSIMPGYIVLVLGDTHAAIVMSIMPVDQWEAFEPTFWEMLETFTFVPTS